MSEHQPTAWTSFFFDLSICVPFAPVGLVLLFDELTDAKIFLILYGTISWYFAGTWPLYDGFASLSLSRICRCDALGMFCAGVMVRLMLTLAPVACMLAAVGLSAVLTRFSAHLSVALRDSHTPHGSGSRHDADRKRPFPAVLSAVMMLSVLGLLLYYSLHATFVADHAYSSPSIVLGTWAQYCLPCAIGIYQGWFPVWLPQPLRAVMAAVSSWTTIVRRTTGSE